MKCLILGHFDQIKRPKSFMTVGDEITDNYLDEIPSYMDYHDEGYFVHEYEEIKSANFIFLVANPLARGGSDIAMISFVFVEESLDPRNNCTYLEQFVENFKGIKNVQTCFYLNRDKISEIQETLEEVENLMKFTFLALPVKPVYIISEGVKVLMLNLNSQDNSILIDFLEKVQNKRVVL